MLVAFCDVPNADFYETDGLVAAEFGGYYCIHNCIVCTVTIFCYISVMTAEYWHESTLAV